MTVKEYHAYRFGKGLRYPKGPYIKKFWDTNPSDEQEEIASKMRLSIAYISLISGGIFGFFIGLSIGLGL
jgi:hypothetical protein